MKPLDKLAFDRKSRELRNSIDSQLFDFEAILKNNKVLSELPKKRKDVSALSK